MNPRIFEGNMVPAPCEQCGNRDGLTWSSVLSAMLQSLTSASNGIPFDEPLGLSYQWSLLSNSGQSSKWGPGFGVWEVALQRSAGSPSGVSCEGRSFQESDRYFHIKECPCKETAAGLDCWG